MAEPVYKVVELVGSSPNTISEAIDNAITRAAISLRGLGWFEVKQVRGALENGAIKQYQVVLKAGFLLED
jgi:flavin-binding protein dodecin